MVAFLSKMALKLFGWKEEGRFPEGKKYVVVAAPHTSMFDFVWGRLYYNWRRKSVRFMVKDKYFFFPLGFWLKSLGALPVIMDKRIGLVKLMVNEFRQRDEFLLTITPEATRKRVNRWKMGFYHIALEAQVPIVLGYIDYKTKTLGVKTTIIPTGNEEADMEIIRKVYESVGARHPEKFNNEKI